MPNLAWRRMCGEVLDICAVNSPVGGFAPQRLPSRPARSAERIQHTIVVRGPKADCCVKRANAPWSALSAIWGDWCIMRSTVFACWNFGTSATWFYVPCGSPRWLLVCATPNQHSKTPSVVGGSLSDRSAGILSAKSTLFRFGILKPDMQGPEQHHRETLRAYSLDWVARLVWPVAVGAVIA